MLASVSPSTFIPSCSTSDNSPCNQQQKRRDPETAFGHITLLTIRQVKNLLLILIGERRIEIIGEFARAPIKPDRSTVTAKRFRIQVERKWDSWRIESQVYLALLTFKSYSVRNATTGSTRRAFRAGIAIAAKAVNMRMADTPANVSGSVGWTPKSI